MLSTIYGILYRMLLGTGISKNKLVNKIHNYIDSKVQKEIVAIEGMKFLGVVENVMQLHVTNLPEIEFCKKEIKKGDTVIDVGANIGYFTLFFSKLVGNNGKVIAFEPDEANFNILKKNIELNKIINVELVQKAVSNKNEVMKLYKSEVSGGHSLIKNEWAKECINIKTTTLDDHIKDKKISLIKIDVEGFELQVIEGAKKLLQNNKNIKIISEFGGYYHKRTKPIIIYPQILHEMGFSLFGVVNKAIGRSKITTMNFEKLMEFYSKTDSFILNLIWK